MPYFIKQTNNSPFKLIDLTTSSDPTLVDFDGDGDLDLFVGTDAGTVQYYRNNGGTYTAANITGITGIDFGTNVSPGFADVDGDGDKDFIVNTTDGQNRYFRNNGGSFTELTEASNPLNSVNFDKFFTTNDLSAVYGGDMNSLYGDLVVGDFNGDGRDDILRQHKYIDNVVIYTTNENGSLTAQQISGYPLDLGGYYANLIVGDFNGDGRDDFLRQEKHNGNDQSLANGLLTDIYISQVDGTFVKQNQQIDEQGWALLTGAANLIVGDFDGDGDDDLIRQAYGGWDDNNSNSVVTYTNDGQGNFTKAHNTIGGANYLLGGDNFNLIVGDFDGQNGEDIIAQDKTGGYSYLFLSNGDGTFANGDVQFGLGYLDFNSEMQRDLRNFQHNLIVGDYNNDGLDDLLFQDRDGNDSFIHFSNGDNSFTKQYNLLENLNVAGNLTNVASGDFNNDGQADLLTNTISGTNEVKILYSKTEDSAGHLDRESFTDLDGDGDVDAYVNRGDGSLDLYLNNGGTYSLYGSLANVGDNATPALADIDEDGHLDAVVGTTTGRLLYFESENGKLVKKTGKDNPLQYIDVGFDAKPSFGDADGDGDKDLIVGARDGKIHHYDNYTPTPTLSLFKTKFVEQFSHPHGWTSYDKFTRQVADVNGDGRDDIIGFGAGATWVALGQSDWSLSDYFIASYNFDEDSGWTSQNFFTREVADVNGDGRADIVGFTSNGAWVALGQANGTFGTEFHASSYFGHSQGWINQNSVTRMLGDVNGDGRADIVGFTSNGAWVALGQGNGTFGSVFHASGDFGHNLGWDNQNSLPRLLGDVNGDGRDDIVGFTSNGAWVALAKSNGSGTFEAAFHASEYFGHNLGWTSQESTPRALADMNGDGRDDIVGFGFGAVAVQEARKDGTFGRLTYAANHFNHSDGWTSFDRLPRQLGDINGDGLADIVGYSEKTFVTPNVTVRPSPQADLFFETEFSTTGKSLWHDGNAFQYDWDFKEWSGFDGISWDVGNYSQDFGDFVTLNSGGTRGNIDFNAGFEVDLGSIDASLPLVTWFGMPGNQSSSSTSTNLKSGVFLSEDAQFDTIFPYLQAYLDADFEIFAGGPSVDFDIPLVPDPSYDPFNLVDINESLHLSFDTREAGLSSDDIPMTIAVSSKDDNGDTKPGSTTTKKGGKNSTELKDLTDYFTFDFQSPEKMNLTSERVDDYTLVAKSSETFFTATVDVDNIISESKYIPPFEYSEEIDLGLGDLEVELNLFDVDLKVAVNVEQEFTLQLDSLTGLLTLENGQQIHYTVGDELTLPHNADANGDGYLEVTTTITPNVTLTNKTSVSYDLDLDLSALSGSAEYEVNYLLDSYSDDVGFGAAWSDSVDLVSGDIFSYDETFALSGFGTESYQFGFDV